MADLASRTWETRHDRGELMAPVERADGTLLLEGFAAKEGILEYRTARGAIRELVTAECLEDSAHGLARCPITLEHPDLSKYPEWVTPDTVAELSVGDTDGEVMVEDGGFVRVRLAVRRRDAIRAIQSGLRELSPGYHALIDSTPGVHPIHGPYDSVQVSRRYNHLALTDSARAGREVRFRADGYASDVIGGVRTGKTSTERGAIVNSRFIGLLAAIGHTGQRIDSDDAAIDAIERKLRERTDSADQARTDASKELMKESARADAEKSRADAAEAKLGELKAAEQSRADAAAKTALSELAAKLGLTVAANADAKAIKRQIAEKHLGSALKADAVDAYVDALVDLAGSASAKIQTAEQDRADALSAGRSAWTAVAAPGPSGSAAATADKLERRKSPTQMSRMNADSAFNAARGDK